MTVSSMRPLQPLLLCISVLPICGIPFTAWSSGAVIGWGDNSSGQATGVQNGYTPGPVTIANAVLDGVVAVSSGRSHSLALRIDGTVVGWGLNNYGQATGVSSTDAVTESGVVKLDGAQLGDVMAISAGDSFSLALKRNGIVVAWGFNDFGQTAVPANMTNVIAIAAGTSRALALRRDGTVASWGKADRALPLNLTNVVSIAAGGGKYERNLALLKDGTVVGWGNERVPEGLSNIIAVAVGEYHSLALKSDGTVFGWGDNDFGEATGVPTTGKPRYSSGTVNHSGKVLSNVVAVAAGNEYGVFGTFCRYSLALTENGKVVGWGATAAKPIAVPSSLSNVVAIAAGHNFCLALTTNDAVAERFRR